MGRAYLIRYGLARSLGRFEAALGTFEPGLAVVIRSHRGTELGEVVAEAPPSLPSGADPAPILRVATLDDLEQAREAEAHRSAHYGACLKVLEGGTWPLELIDAEPLLDERRTVLHYLGPHNLDAAGLIAAFRDRCGLDIVLEPVGRDVPIDLEPEPEAHGCGNCGGSGGGCGSGGCGSGGDCAVKSLVANRRRVAVDGGIDPA